MSIEPREERTGAGIVLMLLAVCLFSGVDTLAKWLSLGGQAVIPVVFARYCGHFICVAVYYLPREGLKAFDSASPLRQLARSVFLVLGTALNFLALVYLPITVTTTINFAGPIVVSLLAVPMLGERVGWRRLAAVSAGFVGVITVIQPWDAAFHPAMFLSIGTLFFAALYFIFTRLLAGVDGHATSQLWPSALGTAVLFPFAFQSWVWPESIGRWVAMFAIGALAACGHGWVTVAHRWADASILAPMFYSQILWATIAGVLLFDTWPNLWTCVGGMIIVASSRYIWQRERRLRQHEG